MFAFQIDSCHYRNKKWFKALKLSNYKYLYGQREFLIPALYGQAELRFCHIDHYAALENELMRDDESKKTFSSPDGSVFIRHKGKTTETTEFKTIKTPAECYCLCLSNTKNSKELFERFKADICLEVDVYRLVKLMTETVNSVLGLNGCRVLSGHAIYFNGQSDVSWNLDNGPYYKDRRFSVEDEYRIVIMPYCDHFFTRHETQIESMKFNSDIKPLRGIYLSDEYRYRYLKKGIIGECVDSFTRYNRLLNNSLIQYSFKE
jgi:hypothetical protein